MSSKGRRDLGLFNAPGDLDDLGVSDDDDLEQELNQLLSKGANKKPKAKPKKPTVSSKELEAMVNFCLADSSDDIDIDIEGDDADLLDALHELESDEEEIPEVPTPTQPPSQNQDDKIYGNSDLVAIVESRIEMYTSAKKVAESTGDSSHAQRYGRALGRLKEIKRQLKLGKPVDENNIPPPLSENQIKQLSKIEVPTTPSHLPTPTPPLPKPPVSINASNQDQELMELKIKRESFKKEALAAKDRQDKEAALQGLRKVKEMDQLIKNYGSPSSKSATKEQENQIDKDKPIQIPSNMDEVPTTDSSVFVAPSPPKTVVDSLNQGLLFYEKEAETAKNEGNGSKARRIGRICKQYQGAIKTHKAGKPIMDKLPVPFGYPPIPVGDNDPAPNPTVESHEKTNQPAPKSLTPSKTEASNHSIQGKQLRILLERQSLFKSAALDAKKSGQFNQAKEYLRQYHGFDNLIEASRGGLPVDLNTTPVPPQLDKSDDSSMDFEVISWQDSTDEGMSRQEMFQKLEKELIDQVKMCDTNKKHFKSTGDIGSSNKFHQMEVHTKKDLEALRHAFKRADPVPKFHYEVRSFSRVVCNTDLSDNDVELSIIEGNNFRGDKSIDTYVCFEFPYPKEEPFKGETSKVKDSISPKFDHTTTIPLSIKEKSCQRIFKRHSVKCDIWIDRGFFRKDILLGSVQIKLQPLETQCTIHECFPIMDGRKAAGGTLEVRVRLRNPILAKQVEKVQEKWLVISF
ncbi:coiled-coil and C2 domain-containing protein 1-like isoform X1 [Lepeophtheirus salmonis]|uniref:coiled-coil and C2 domain-containing protein 1-like isoform X1 n=2 Tax=Lepeophtheirus salmonis TaxID=72036 RepID=UPI001AE1ED7F|nr:coiled-coil and C2 domain-containing protein 1-like isoform X1 [Lepeophtheirus salmonis]